MKIKIALLAAGEARRFQKNKLLTIFDEKPLIQYPFDLLKEYRKMVVVISQYPEIENLAKEYRYHYIENQNAKEGISTSIKLAIREAEDFDGILFMVADQPYLKKETVQTILESIDDFHVIRTTSKKQKGNPVFFPKRYFKELLALEGDTGGRAVMMKHSKAIKEVMAQEWELFDIDEEKDAKTLLLKKTEQSHTG